MSASLLTLAAVGIDKRTAKDWHQIAYTGRFEGHPQGPFQITRAHLAEMAANFTADGRGRIPIDYEHQTIRSVDNGKPAPAAGWELELELRAEGEQLWGRPSWTAAALSAIEGDEYAFLSPTIQWRSRDRVTGKERGARLHSVALTNTPFLDQLPPIAASEDGFMTEHEKKLRGLLGLAETATDAEVQTRLAAWAETRKLAVGQLGLSETATDGELLAAARKGVVRWKLGELALSELALTAETDPEKVVAIARPKLQHAGYIPLTEHQAVRAELERLKVGHEVDNLVRTALTEGKLTPAMEPWAKTQSAEQLRAFLACAAPVHPGPAKDRTDPKRADGAASALSETQKTIARQLSLSDEDYAKTLKLEG